MYNSMPRCYRRSCSRAPASWRQVFEDCHGGLFQISAPGLATTTVHTTPCESDEAALRSLRHGDPRLARQVPIWAEGIGLVGFVLVRFGTRTFNLGLMSSHSNPWVFAVLRSGYNDFLCSGGFVRWGSSWTESLKRSRVPAAACLVVESASSATSCVCRHAADR